MESDIETVVFVCVFERTTDLISYVLIFAHNIHSVLSLCDRSLVTTNDHLLKELEETKKRHKEQMQHMTNSYNQLRRHVMPQMPQQAPAQQTQRQVHAYEAS